MFFVSFIGSRSLAEPAFEKDAQFFYKVAYRFAQLGIGLRSGGANGADLIAETAYRDAINNSEATADQVQIFVPWKPFQAVRGINNPLHHLHILPSDPVLIQQSVEMVKDIHPAFDKLSQGAIKLHSRNMNQVFGIDLQSPIKANICWTQHGIKKGGTRSAIELCERNSIPVFNLGRPDIDNVQQEIKDFLISMNVSGLK